jgi:hypothetical protein
LKEEVNLKKYEDITAGKVFGRITVLETAGRNKHGHLQWLCKCECDGKTIIVLDHNLKKGYTKGCGCLKKDKKYSQRGEFHKQIYSVYCNMKVRCYNENHECYHHYGGRGIKICDEWLDDYMNFYNWAIATGYTKGLSIDRIDVNGNYEPLNCRWITMEEQQKNKRNNFYITIGDETKILSEWSKISGLSVFVIKYRVNQGITGEDLLKPYQTDTPSGIKGVTWNKKAKQWIVRHGQKHIGCFKNLEDAIKAKVEYKSKNT